ncbi:MAG TPA: hypothetical protein VN894_02280 [Polyangiaceae bacterium]|nr:hypothetical protein [Polyangiaceae bacterium]
MLPRLRPLALAAFTALLLAGLLSCRPKAGQECTDTPGSCIDKSSHAVCVNKKYVIETCEGKDGCNDDGKALVCDNTKADLGDGCAHEGARACSNDGKYELRCRETKFAIEWSCRGGCTLDANSNPKCTPTGEVGDTCRPDSIVCDGAQKTELSCVGGKLAVHRTCHGERACQTLSGGGVGCDRSIAFEGEDCQEEGTGACDTTRKNVLVCTGGHFKTQLHCLGPLGCELPGNYSTRCDKSIVKEGEACDEEMAPSCSTEGKQVQCKDGQFVVDKKWKPKKGETCNNRYRISKEVAKFEAR